MKGLIMDYPLTLTQFFARGITDAAGFERAVLAEQLNGALLLIGGTLGGALAGGLIYGATAGGPALRPREPATAEPSG